MEPTRQERRDARQDAKKRRMRVHGKRYVATVLAAVAKKGTRP